MTTPKTHQPTGKAMSAAAYEHARNTGQTMSKRVQVLSHLCTAGASLTRQDISEQTGMPINAVCGRVSELLDMGLVEVDGVQSRDGQPARQLLKATHQGRDAFEGEGFYREVTTTAQEVPQ